MEKILRLSVFNLRKNRREAAAIIFLTFVTVLLMGTSVTNILGMSDTYDECFRATGSCEYYMEFEDDIYRSLYRDILEEDFGITDNVKFNMLFGLNINVEDEDGERLAYHFMFMTEESEKKTEDFVIEESLPDDQIQDLAHPVWIPVGVNKSGGYKPGDAFTLVIGGRDYPFVVAGIFDTGLGNNSGYGYKLIISDRDYELLRGIIDERICLGFDGVEGFDPDEYTKECELRSSENLRTDLTEMSYWAERGNETSFFQLFMFLSLIMAGITMTAAIFLIRHKISNDIEDQIQQIGVLEALGYRSFEISESYIFEYVITAGTGAVLGAAAAFACSPVMDSLIGNLMGRIIHRTPELLKIFAVMVFVVAVTTLFALLKAGSIRKYPPVTAFRKGIKTHHFNRNFVPLTGAGKNINVTLAFKSFFKNIKTNIGTGLCIVLAGTAMMFGVSGWDHFKGGTRSLIGLMGMETADERIQLLDGVNAYEFADELMTLPEVRKTLVTYKNEYLVVEGSPMETTAIVYDDYSQTENIFLNEGKYPELDNEVAISLKRSRDCGLNVGDSVTIEGNGTRKSFIITGIIPEMSNNRYNIYLNAEGYLRCVPNARPDTVEVFLEDGVDRYDFERKMTEIYGASAKDTAEGVLVSGDLRDRIQAVAEQQMATLISRYGVTDIDYAVVAGGQVITGKSSRFVIREMNSYLELAKIQLEPIASLFTVFCGGVAIFVSIVVAAILAIIAASNVRRQRKDLGIMKSMGYTSKDLMKQLAISMLPTTLVAVMISAFFGAYLYRMFWLFGFGIMNDPNIPMLVITSAALVIFCYIATYLAAGKIRQVSATELMTE
ncbi:MAG: ABC transporter permease [Lachnospiraceae bacterium]|nr:ABC transporter permease [Lachnospiraceae bacterium]